MITVENFYWVLYHTLLKPTNIDCRYYYPFGTTQNLSKFEFNRHLNKDNKRRDCPYVLFHFDQEPIYLESDHAIYRGSNSNYLKTARILANSEYSFLKKKVCQKHQLLDWYFFYHGFAALDWYRDMAYIDHDPGFTHTFLSYNHLVRHRRAYRMALTARLVERDLIHKGLVSFHSSWQNCLEEMADEHSLLSNKDRLLITNHLGKMKLPMHVDNDQVNGTFSARLGPNEHWWRRKALFHVVNETVFFDQKLHLTEKIFQPVVMSRPFILVAAPGNLDLFRKYGFRTFSHWIDESYDQIVDNDQRLDAITQVLTKINQMPRAHLEQIFADMQSTLEYNKRHFFGKFRRIIVDEMVDNFDTCVRIWNNGRVDGRNITSHPDLKLAREILLR